MIALLAMLSAADAYELSGRSYLYQDAPVEDPFAINVDTFPGTYLRSEVEDGWIEGMRVWNSQGQALVTLTHGGLTTVNQFGGGDDGTNSGRWTLSASDASVALSTRTFINDSDIIDCDIQFYGGNVEGAIIWNFDSSAPAGPDEYSFIWTATHEFGHCLGLSHSEVADAVMRPTQSRGLGPSDWDLRDDDIAGIQELYGASVPELALTSIAHTLPTSEDGEGIPGSAFQVSVGVENTGTGTAPGVMGLLEVVSGGDHVTLVSTSSEMGDIAPGSASGSIDSELLFDLMVPADCLNTVTVELAITVSDALGNTLDGTDSVEVVCPEPEREYVDDLDGTWSPGCDSSGQAAGWGWLAGLLVLRRRMTHD